MKYYEIKTQNGTITASIKDMYEDLMDISVDTDSKDHNEILKQYKSNFEGECTEIPNIKNYKGGEISGFIPTYLKGSVVADIKTPTGKKLLRPIATNFKINLFTPDNKYFHERDNHSVNTPRNNTSNKVFENIYKKRIDKILGNSFDIIKDDIKSQLKKEGYQIEGFYVSKYDSGRNREVLSEVSMKPTNNINEIDTSLIMTMRDTIYDNIAKNDLEMASNIEKELKKNKSRKVEEPSID